jgi:hypothetical protein
MLCESSNTLASRWFPKLENSRAIFPNLHQICVCASNRNVTPSPKISENTEMKKRKVQLAHFYGIKQLAADFDFSKSGVYAIYAPKVCVFDRLIRCVFLRHSKKPVA